MTPPQETSKPPCYRDDAMEVVARLRDAGHVAYFAGGCVRDLLMGLEPKDYDVATDAPPDKVRSLFRNTQAVGAAFGVILVKIHQSVVEVATFRADGEYLDGRRPCEVRFTNAEEDARRRDFTINGLFLDPAKNEVIDFVGGQADITAQILRAIGDPSARFDEDYLRMLRAVRFAARFALTIDLATGAAIRKHAPQLAQISPERIAEELRGMLIPPTRGIAHQLLNDLGLAAVLFRRFNLPRRRLISLLPHIASNDCAPFALILAAITLSEGVIGPTLLESLDARNIRLATRIWRETLKISNDETDMMIGALSVGHLLQPHSPTVAQMKRFLAAPYSAEAIVLLKAISQEAYSERIHWLLAQFDTFPPDQIAPPPLVTGDDLIANGLHPGKQFKDILNHVYDLQLEAKLVEKQSALREAITLFKAGNDAT